MTIGDVMVAAGAVAMNAALLFVCVRLLLRSWPRTHQHTCTECYVKFPCLAPDSEDDCSGVDGDGRCPACAERAFDALGKRDGRA